MFAIIFDSQNVVKPSTFAANIPAAISRPASGRDIPTVFTRTRDDEPTDDDRRAWYFAAEIAAMNAELDRMAEEAEWASLMSAGRVGC